MCLAPLFRSSLPKPPLTTRRRAIAVIRSGLPGDHRRSGPSRLGGLYRGGYRARSLRIGHYRDHDEAFLRRVREGQAPADRADALAHAHKAVTQFVRGTHSPAVIGDREPNRVALPPKVVITLNRNRYAVRLGMAHGVAQSLLDDTADRRADDIRQILAFRRDRHLVTDL